MVREEMSEADTERYLLNQWIEYRLWNEVKGDEAIQLAAMICKLERSQRRWPEKIREL